MTDQACARRIRSSALAIATALLVVRVAGRAHAQQASPNGDKPPSAAEVSPRGQGKPREIKYGDWRKFCFKPAGTKMICRTTISGTWETGQIAVRVDLIERDGDGTARLQILLPVGFYLQAGVELAVDNGNAYRVPYVWCLNAPRSSSPVTLPCKVAAAVELPKSLGWDIDK